MTILAEGAVGHEAKVKKKVRRPPLIRELYDLTEGNMKLLMIYKKIEIAAEAGDWSLMNELYGEFKAVYASAN